MRAIPFMSSAPSAVFLLCLLLFSVSQKPFFFFFLKLQKYSEETLVTFKLVFLNMFKKIKRRNTS